MKSRGCKCKPKCEVDVIASIGKKPLVYSDPHECNSCKRRFTKKLKAFPSGAYFCGLEDCLDVKFKRLPTIVKEYLGIK